MNKFAVVSTTFLSLGAILVVLLSIYVTKLRPDLFENEGISEAIKRKIRRVVEARTESENKRKNFVYFAKDTSIKRSFLDENGVDFMDDTADLINFKKIDKIFKIQAEIDSKSKSKGSVDIASNRKHLDPIKMPSESVDLSKLRHEIRFPDKPISPPPVPSEKVEIFQLGLKVQFMENKQNLVAGVYQIFNLFGQPGLIGHYFHLERTPFDSTTTQNSVAVSTSPYVVDFSSLNKYKENKIPYTTDEGFDVIHQSVDQKETGTLFLLKKTVIPNMDKDTLVLDPLNFLCKCLEGGTSNEKVTFLVYNNLHHQQKLIKYAPDVELFDHNILSKLDWTIFTAGKKRIQNHCKAFINPELKEI